MACEIMRDEASFIQKAGPAAHKDACIARLTGKDAYALTRQITAESRSSFPKFDPR